MIEYIFWDNDECLSHSMFKDPNQDHHKLILDDGPDTIYYLMVRPSAKEVLEYSRELVGYDNVFMLTTASDDYAQAVNKAAGFGFEEDHILDRKFIKKYVYSSGWGGCNTVPAKSLANKDNVLIDNLLFTDNYSKTTLIGIQDKPKNYFQVHDYYGINRPDDTFKLDVMNFLKTKYNEN